MEMKASAFVSNLQRTQREASGFNVLLNMFPEAVFGFDKKGLIRSANSKFADILGLTVEDVVNQPLKKFLVKKAEAGSRVKMVLQAKGRKPVTVLLSDTGTAKIDANDPGISYMTVRKVN